MNSSTISLLSVAKRNSDGSLNLDETMSAIRVMVESWELKTRADLGTVLAAVNSVFDKLPGAQLNMLALTSAVMGELQASPTEYATIAERVDAVIKSNPTVFGQAKKKGTYRLADQKKEETKAA